MKPILMTKKHKLTSGNTQSSEEIIKHRKDGRLLLQGDRGVGHVEAIDGHKDKT